MLFEAGEAHAGCVAVGYFEVGGDGVPVDLGDVSRVPRGERGLAVGRGWKDGERV